MNFKKLADNYLRRGASLLFFQLLHFLFLSVNFSSKESTLKSFMKNLLIAIVVVISFFRATSVCAQSKEQVLEEILAEVQELFKGAFHCDTLLQDERRDEIFDRNGRCATLHKKLEEFVFHESLRPFKNQIQKLVECRKGCPMVKRTHSTNYHSQLNWRLKYILYSIDYIGLSPREKFYKVLNVFPEIIEMYPNGKFGHLKTKGRVTNFEVDLLSATIHSVSDDEVFKMAYGESYNYRKFIFRAICSGAEQERLEGFLKRIEQEGKSEDWKTLIIPCSIWRATSRH